MLALLAPWLQFLKIVHMSKEEKLEENIQGVCAQLF